MNLEEQAAEMLSFDMWREEVADAVAMTQPQGEQDMVDLLNRPERHLILSTTGGILEQGGRVRQIATSFHVGAEPDGVISISMMTKATDKELLRLWPGSTIELIRTIPDEHEPSPTSFEIYLVAGEFGMFDVNIGTAGKIADALAATNLEEVEAYFVHFGLRMETPGIRMTVPAGRSFAEARAVAEGLGLCKFGRASLMTDADQERIKQVEDR